MKHLLNKYRHWAESLTGYQLFIITLNLLILASIWATFIKLDAWLGTMYRHFIRLMVVAVVSLGLLTAQAQTREPPPPPEHNATCWVAVCALCVGGVMVYGVYKLCQRIPQINTNDPPGYASGALPSVVLSDSTERFSMPTFSEIQTSTNLQHWSEALTLKFDAQAACIVYRGGVATETNIPYLLNGQLRYFIKTTVEPKPSALFRMLTQ